MLADAEPVVVLTHVAVASEVRELLARHLVIDLEADSDLWREEPERNPSNNGLTPEHLAYVILYVRFDGRTERRDERASRRCQSARLGPEHVHLEPWRRGAPENTV